MSIIDPDSTDTDWMTVRFFHLDKSPVALRAGLGIDEFESLESALAGVPSGRSHDIRADLASIIARTGAELAAQPTVLDATRHLPFAPGDVVIALGDSITDDLLSWAHLLAEVLRITRPELGLSVINAGITGNTTQEVISRFDTVARARPDWVLQMLGTNDARRHGTAQVMTTSSEETRRNLKAIHLLIETDTSARLVAMTPPPMDERAVQGWVPFQREQITWRASDIDDVADAVRALPVPVIDIQRALGPAPLPFLLPDGLHPNLAGQRRIAEAVLVALPALTRSPMTTTAEKLPNTTERSQ